MRKPTKSPEQNPFTDFYSNTPYEEKQLSTSVINSGQAYQRPIRKRRVNNIKDNFDPKLLDPPVVSFRDGKFYLIDGQHRIAALKLLNGGNDVFITCRVITGLSYKQEAELYERLDSSKSKLSMGDKTRAAAESGAYKNIADIKNVLSANHIEWLFNSHGGTNGQITATRSLIKAYDELKFEGFQRMIQILYLTWKGDKQSLSMYILSGMSLFFKTYGSEIKDANFIKRLSKYTPQELISAGKSDQSTSDMSLKFARVLLNKYNYKQCKNVLGYRFNG